MHAGQSIKYIAFEAELRRKGDITLYYCFDSLKRFQVEINGCFSDTLGGHIKKTIIPELAKKLGYRKDTLRRKMYQMVAKGWAIPTNTGYKLISWKRVAAMYNLEFIPKRRADKTKKVKNAKKDSFKTYYEAQIRRATMATYKKLADKQRIQPQLISKTKHDISRSSDVSVSTRQVAESLGYKSPKTITNWNRELQKQKFLKIEKRSEFFCEPSEYYFRLDADQSLAEKCFFNPNDEKIHIRLKNNISLNKRLWS